MILLLELVQSIQNEWPPEVKYVLNVFKLMFNFISPDCLREYVMVGALLISQTGEGDTCIEIASHQEHKNADIKVQASSEADEESAIS